MAKGTTFGKKTTPVQKRTGARAENEKLRVPKGQVRDSIVEAVGRVLAREGIANTTVEAIAVEAGMSKGGVLYYFPNKKDLLASLVKHYENDFRERQEALLAKLPPTPHRNLKSAVMLMVSDMEKNPEAVPNLGSMLDDPDLRQDVLEIKRQTFKEAIRGAADPAEVALILYTVDGLWMDLKFNPMVIPPAKRRAAIKALLKYIDSLDQR